jgi:hypothetical protein
MTHHLMRRHSPPTAGALRMHVPQPLQELGLISLSGQGSHHDRPIVAQTKPYLLQCLVYERVTPSVQNCTRETDRPFP